MKLNMPDIKGLKWSPSLTTRDLKSKYVFKQLQHFLPTPQYIPPSQLFHPLTPIIREGKYQRVSQVITGCLKRPRNETEEKKEGTE